MQNQNIVQQNELKPYRVAITETYRKEVEIYAESEFDAKNIAHELCSDNVIQFDADDFQERDVECRGVANGNHLALHEVYGEPESIKKARPSLDELITGASNFAGIPHPDKEPDRSI